jgi:nucleoside 2-deoxyribosyltransferase
MKPKVYLAGPITGLSYGDSTDWREFAKASLADAGIDGFSPMRAKDYLLQEKILSDDYADLSVLSTGKGITTRDRWDTTTADLVLVNLLGADKVSIGTVIEVAWADLSRTPVVAALEPGNVHEHSMLLDAVGFRTASLEEALHVAKAVLLP